MTQTQLTEEDIFHLARKIGAAEARADYLQQACAGDTELQARIIALLRAHDEEQSFLESPPAAVPTVTERGVTEAPGTTIGPYKLLEQIGEGGFGVVFMAEQTHPVKRKVALKVIKPGMDTRQVIARFEAERQALALMDHPNIAKVFDAGTTGGGARSQESGVRGHETGASLTPDSCLLTPSVGRPYFVMELVRGVPITDYCDQHQLTPKERLELFVTVCQAVQHAHQKGIIHRDIKPSNVLVTLHDDRPVVKVIDFGIAKATSGQLTDKTVFTGFAQMVGTPLYMSPEQAALSGIDVDTRSDIYSLGVLLYELLTGTTPFDKTRLQEAAFDEVRRIIREEEPAKPSTRLSDLGSGRHTPYAVAGGTQSVPANSLASIAALRKTEPRKLSQLVKGDLDWIVMKALEKDRARRYETANGFAADILHYLADEPVSACPPSAGYRFRKFARRNKAALATGALVSAALVSAVVVLAVSNVFVRAERNEKMQALDAKEKALGEKQAALTQAQSSYTEAKRQEGIAKDQQQIATDQALLARRRFYASQMNLAMQAWKGGEVPRVLELLEGQRPGPDDEDLRGFEWYYLWRLCNGGRRLYLHGHTRAVLSVAFSPDGGTLASASWDGSVRLWETATGKERMVLRGQLRGPWTVAFSPDGRTLASAGQETESLILWDVATGKPLQTIAGPVLGLAFSRDSSIIAGGLVTESGVHLKISVKLWDVATGTERLTLPNAGVVIGFLSDENTLVTMSGQHSSGGEVQFWDLETQAQRQKISVPYLRNAGLSNDGTRVATTSGNVTLWDTTTGERQASFAQQGSVRALAFSPDDKKLAAGDELRTVLVWDVETGRRLGQDVHLDPVGGVAFSPDGKTLASSTAAGAIKLWDMTPAEEATTIPNVVGPSLGIDSSGRTLLVGNAGPTKVIDVAAGKEVAVLPVSGIMAVSADAGTLAGPAGADEGVLWDVSAGRTVADFPLKRVGVNPGVALSPDGKCVATYYRWNGDNTVRLWGDATKEPRTLTVPPPESNRLAVECAEFSPNGKLLAAGFQFQWVTVWDVATGKVKLEFSQEPAMMWVRAVAFSPDSKALAVGTDVGAVTLWEVESGRRLASFRGHTSNIHALAFSPDGKTLASACADKTVRLWDVVTGQERGTLTGHDGPVVNVRFTPDGNTLVTAGGDGTVKLWRAATDPEALARRTSVAADDPHYVIATEYSRSAWNLVTYKLEERDPVRAVELAQKALALFPQSARYWLTLGVAHYRAADWQAALVALDKSEELMPGQYIYKEFFRAMALWQLGDREQARDRYERAAEWVEQHAPHDPWYSRFQYEAATLLELPAPPTPILALPPGSISTSQKLAELQRRRAALDERAAAAPADRWERRQLAFDYYQLALALRDSDQLPEAEAVCRQALYAFRSLADEDPHELQHGCDAGWASHVLSDVLARRRRFAEAVPLARESIARFQSLVDARPDWPEYRDAIAVAYAPLAHVLAQLGKPEEAAQAQRDAQAVRQAAEELRRTLPSAQELLESARPFAETRDWKQAAAALDRGFARQPRTELFLCFSTALARLLAGDVEGYARLADSMPVLESLKWDRWSRLDVLRTCTMHARGTADPAALIPLAQSAYDEEANNWSAQNLGMAHYRAGEFDAALQWMEQARELGEWYLFYPALAMTRHQLGHPEEARLWLEKANASFRDFVPPSGERLKILPQNAWQDWAYFEVMLQEARTLIGETGELTESELRTALQCRTDSAELQRGLGLLLQNDGRLAEAEPFLREVVRLAPGRLDAHAELAEVLRRQQKLAEAEAVLNEAIRREPGQAWMHERLGWVLWEQKEFAAAERAFRESLRLKPDVWGAQFGLGQALYDQQRSAEAVAPLREAIRLDPTLHFVHGILAWALLQQQLLAEAEAEFREQVRLKPDEAPAHSGLGRALLDRQEFPAAEAELRETLRLDPTDHGAPELLSRALVGQGMQEAESFGEVIRIAPANHVARSLLGWAHARKQEFAEAEVAFREATRLNPDDSHAHRGLGSALLEQQRLPAAETELREALRLDPTDPWAPGLLSRALVGQGKLEEAEAFLTELVRRTPDRVGRYTELATVLRKRQKFTEAEAALREAIGLDPGRPGTHESLGWMLSEQKRFSEAEVAFREAVRLKPDLATAQFGLGNSLREQKKFGEALVALREAIQLDPAKPQAHSGLGSTLLNLNQLGDAELEFRAAIRLKPDLAGAHLGLGRVLQSLSRPAEAVEALREAVRLDPNHYFARDLLGWLFVDLARFAEAEAEFRAMIRLKPDVAAGHFGLGRALVEQQEFAAGESALRDALRLNPARRDAPDLLNRALIGQGKPPETQPPGK